MKGIFQITGKVFSSPYDWGGNSLIPSTLGFEAEEGKPYAEYWLGVHPKAPSQVVLPDGQTTTLDKLVSEDKEGTLGTTIKEKFGSLPFLFKLLDAGEMLSIQVHPNKQQAEEGFAREEAAGIPFTDPKRTYKDNNHKPEFAVVQGDFWLLHGFRTEENLRQVLGTVPEFESLLPHFQKGNYRELYKYVMQELSDEEADQLLKKLAVRVVLAFEAGKLEKSNPDYWAARAVAYMKMSEGNYDRGLFSIYFLNLVNMKPGQAIFQDAGLLHAYLEGPIIEVMANSDNVARGGITPKHVDIEELMKLVKFEGITPHIIEGRREENESFFEAPIDEFAISKIQPSENKPFNHTANAPEILIGMDGNAKIKTPETELSVAKGKSVFVSADTEYEITGNENDVVYRTSVPVN